MDPFNKNNPVEIIHELSLPESKRFQNKYRIESARLKKWDYSSGGAYFVTICTKNRECCLGMVKNGEMHLNDYGNIVNDEWIKTPLIRRNVKLDSFVVMPNHFHGVVHIRNGTGVICDGRDTARRVSTLERFGKPVCGSIPTILRSFKSAVTKCINEIQKTPGAIIWQRNYYEHIIRDENDLLRIQKYIDNNPLKWDTDRNNSENLFM